MVICDKEDIETIKNNKRTIKVPHSVDCLQGILSVIPLQLLAFHLAVLRGYDVSTASPALGAAGGCCRPGASLCHCLSCCRARGPLVPVRAGGAQLGRVAVVWKEQPGSGGLLGS